MKRHTLLAACMFVAACLMVFGKAPGSASDGKAQQRASDPAREAKRVVVQAAGRGNPYINFDDGIEIAASYDGAAEMLSVLKQNAAEPRALASADFDEDGVPDLICGYAHEGGGLVTLYRGNVDSIYPNSPEAQRRKAEGIFTDSAFLSPARVFEAPAACDFVGAGDFDADGHWDVVIAARGSKELWMFPGDGKGSFLTPRKIALSGAVKSLITGEINRADGLTDIVVGVVAEDGPKALVFEGPEGALRANPEVFALPGEPKALALGQFDDDYPMDLAVGAGSELVIIHGRDRKLSLDHIRQAEVLPAQLDRQAFGFEIQSIAAADFTASDEISIALLASDGTVRLTSAQKVADKKAAKKKADPEVFGQWAGATQLVCARVSTGPADDLVILNRDGHSLHIQKTGLAELSRSAHSSSVRAGTSFDLAGAPSAVLPMRLNADALSDLVVLQGGGSAPVILKTTAPQTFTVNKADDHDDGICDSGDCTLREAINAANGNSGADTIAFNIPGFGVHTITPTSNLPPITNPITIDGTTQPGFAGSPVIELAGNGSVFVGLSVESGSSLVQGLVMNRFLIAGLVITGPGNNLVVGNFLGTDPNGTTASPNRAGLLIGNSPGNIIGGTTSASRNIISGNAESGVQIDGSGSPGTVVQGNFIGTDVSGLVALGNSGANGISIGSAANTIGGAIASARNIISGNAHYGIQLGPSGLEGNLVQGNFIGTNVVGSAALGNFFSGISLGGNPSTTIGGTTPAARNIISGHRSYGVEISANGSAGIRVQGNFIGTDVTGSVALGNHSGGIAMGNTLNGLIGGAVTGARNVISASDDPNAGHGILLGGIGLMEGSQIQGNYIGTDATGALALGNRGAGIFVDGTNDVTIGGAEAATSNLIAFNLSGGVFVQSGLGIAVHRNSIFSNGALGIDLAPLGCLFVLGCHGVTPNDLCDSDNGGNALQNFPVLTSAISYAPGMTVQGALNSKPNTTFTLEFFANSACDPSGFGEGQTFIGSTTVTTDGSCNGSFNVTLPVSVPSGQIITATATDPAGNTSEFSQCVQVQPAFDLCLQDESNGNILLVNSRTGEYQFTNCRGLTLTGVGSLTTKGCLATLQVNGPDRRILARIDTCLESATASVQVLSQGTTFTILDRNTANNNCVCAGPG